MGPSGWVSGWILWPLERQGTVTIHSFTFTLCNRGRPFGAWAQGRRGAGSPARPARLETTRRVWADPAPRWASPRTGLAFFRRRDAFFRRHRLCGTTAVILIILKLQVRTSSVTDTVRKGTRFFSLATEPTLGSSADPPNKIRIRPQGSACKTGFPKEQGPAALFITCLLGPSISRNPI